jgi:hypothetical protein
MTKNKLDRVLKWVNRVRADNGLKPLKKLPIGMTRSITTCPISKAISRECSTYGNSCAFVDTFGETVEIPTPLYVQDFIEEVDQHSGYVNPYKLPTRKRSKAEWL